MKIALIYFFIHVKYYFISLKPYKLTIYFAVIMVISFCIYLRTTKWQICWNLHKHFFQEISTKVFSYHSSHIADTIEASGKLSKLLATFIRENFDEFLSYDKVKVYYDNGQIELTRILSSVLNALLPNVEFRKVLPSEYRLFQVSSLIMLILVVKRINIRP